MGEKIKKIINLSIKRRILVFFIPMFIIVFVIFGAITCTYYQVSMRNRSIKDSEQLVKKISDSMDYYFEDINSALVTITMQESVIKLLKMQDENDYVTRLKLEREIQELTININTFKNYISDVFIINDTGIKYSSKNLLRANYDIYSETWFQTDKFKNYQGITYVLPHETGYYSSYNITRQNVISVIMPVFQGSRRLGYVMCDIDIDRIHQLVQDKSLDKEEMLYVIDENGNIVMKGEDGSVNFPDALIEEIKFSKSFSRIEERMLFVTSKMKSTGWNVVSQIPEKNITKQAMSIVYFTIIILIFCIVFTIMFTTAIAYNIQKPLTLLVKNVKRFGSGEFYYKKEDYGYGEIASLGSQFEQMADKIQILVRESFVYELEKKKMEYNALVNQINPHFLYNALQLMQMEAVISKNEVLEQIINELAFLMRYTMDISEDIVRLKDELDYAESYLQLYKRRFSERFTYEISVDDELMQASVLKFLLQPILENCFKHAFKNKEINLHIKIKVERENNCIIVKVLDNGDGVSEDKLKSIMNRINNKNLTKSIGLRNTNQRLKIKYKELNEAGLIMESVINEYTQVSIILPFII